MKTIFISLLFFGAITSVKAQNVKASLGLGSTPNSVKIYIRPDITLNGVNIGTLQFNLGVSSAITPVATGTIASTTASFPAVSNWTLSRSPTSEGGYVHYSIFTNVSPIIINTTANTDIEVMEIKFTEGSLSPQNVSLVCLPGGGTIGTGLFYFTSSNLNSNGVSLFYARTPSITVNNQNSYDADGNPGTGTSTATIGNISLPTKFLAFFATKSNDVANLTWTVDNEENNAYFDVERSLDGRNFTKAYQVQALRNGRTSNSYTTPDANISRLGVKTIYYRIKQVEASGQIVYSDIRQVNLVDKNFSASLFPNPVKSNTTLVMDAPEAGKATVIIRDVAGKTIKSISLQLVKGINQQQLDASMFAAGDYNVTIVSEKMNQTIKMTKAN